MSNPKNTVLLYNALQTAYSNTDNSPSFSLMALSAYLKTKGYNVELLLNRYTDTELKTKLKDCLTVGFSLYTGGAKNALHIASRIRNLAPEIPLVWGGYHPTLEAQQTIENEYVDYVVRGQGELILEELLEYLKNPEAGNLNEILGLSYKHNGKVYHNAVKPSVDINNFPSLDYSLYDHVFDNIPTVHYVTSRGCPFACKFCCTAAFNRNHGMRFYQLSMEHVLNDLETLTRRYKPKQIDFMDDNFFVNPNRVRKFAEGYKKRGFSFKWTAFGRCDFFARVDDKLLKTLEETGLLKVFFGVESGSQRVLDMVNKQIKLTDILTSVDKIHKYNILGDFTFINGLPHETKDEIFKSIELCNHIKKSCPNSTVRFFVYTPLPGTETMKECIPLGYKKPTSIEGWKSYEYHSFQAPWLSAKYRNFINNISWAALFDSLDLSIYRNPIIKGLFKILAADAKLRFRYKAFDFAPEFEIVNKIYRNRMIKG